MPPSSFAITIVVFAAWVGLMAVVRLHARTAFVESDDFAEPFGDFPSPVDRERGAGHGGARLNADRGMHSVHSLNSVLGEDAQ